MNGFSVLEGRALLKVNRLTARHLVKGEQTPTRLADVLSTDWAVEFRNAEPGYWYHLFTYTLFTCALASVLVIVVVKILDKLIYLAIRPRHTPSISLVRLGAMSFRRWVSLSVGESSAICYHIIYKKMYNTSTK